ncbi:hypothetical protein Terro_2352 [Terriglobus roseus DSM 18391]|uniref:Uncharacterized protein n=1 Tax=Terriglobus roseus (strain DSM 18391 / NRRL B-41598 / KBS 63) TaxID=926566 RepID=I3ZH95_TERRK|nr:hypothetical protein [Terriglobus roseus]AFL88272.1 hypothetical protein Terro_1986 [Terriglobus roseus DSM 18391]AFL88613.1 hypothetical protein Terro_2352 [Terriglobus roseus DSM 18391]
MESVEIRGNKTTNDLLREAGWFALHSLLAVVVLIAILAGFWGAHVDPDAATPKMLCTILAFVIPGLAAYGIMRTHPDGIAGYVWISGALFFGVVCVYVLDLPTGPGLCEHCTLIERLYRTFFSITHNSGMLGGDGVLIGAWIPLSIIGYSVGARLATSAVD